jgi:hypothetical protein
MVVACALQYCDVAGLPLHGVLQCKQCGYLSANSHVHTSQDSTAASTPNPLIVP